MYVVTPIPVSDALEETLISLVEYSEEVVIRVRREKERWEGVLLPVTDAEKPELAAACDLPLEALASVTHCIRSVHLDRVCCFRGVIAEQILPVYIPALQRK